MRNSRVGVVVASFCMLALWGAQACDSTSPPEMQTPAKLQLVVSDAPLQLVAPTSVLIELIAIGANGKPVTFTAPGAPSFVSLSATLLTLAPTRADVGSYAIPLVAATATQQATATLSVDVTRANTGPMWLPSPFVLGTETVSSDPPVFIAPYLSALVCDDEGDNFTFQVEVVAAGHAFTRKASYTQSIDFTVTPPLSYELPKFCGDFKVPFTGLAPGDYDVAVHAVDVLGAEDPYGWVMLQGFTVAP